MYERVQELIEQNPGCVEFAPFGEGVSEEWIVRAQEALGFPLPASYKWFLKNYAGGEIAGQEILSVYATDFETAGPGDVVYTYLLDREQGLIGTDKLVICDNGDEYFYLDLRERSGPEYRVWRVDLNESSDEVYADDFASFLEKRIRFLCLYETDG